MTTPTLHASFFREPENATLTGNDLFRHAEDAVLALHSQAEEGSHQRRLVIQQMTYILKLQTAAAVATALDNLVAGMQVVAPLDNLAD